MRENSPAEKTAAEEYERLREWIRESEREFESGNYVVADDAFFERKKQMIREQFMKRGT